MVASVTIALLLKIILSNIMDDRLTVRTRPGRVFEIVTYWQILLVNPPLQELLSIGHDLILHFSLTSRLVK
ncbi:MAG: hypothetical protein HC942_17805 [Microcoleus sp. SU_5_6]|nr:hypothetical protein [Microcoleus sp. SU_5_6]NJL65905.1 hypothetical protein [Microcoleus sp. SM1_3_4]